MNAKTKVVVHCVKLAEGALCQVVNVISEKEKCCISICG